MIRIKKERRLGGGNLERKVGSLKILIREAFQSDPEKVRAGIRAWARLLNRQRLIKVDDRSTAIRTVRITKGS